MEDLVTTFSEIVSDRDREDTSGLDPQTVVDRLRKCGRLAEGTPARANLLKELERQIDMLDGYLSDEKGRIYQVRKLASITGYVISIRFR